MKKIGVIFAMKEELDKFLDKVQLDNNYKIFDIDFFECSYNSFKIILALSGIGKVNAARCTQILIDNIDVDFIFNIGVAGSINCDVHVCDIVLGEKLVQHDFDLTSFDHEKGHIPNVGRFIKCDEYLLRIAKEVSFSSTVHTGVIASGDIFLTEKEMSMKVRNKFNALCVEMEGASIAQVCYLSGIPFLVIRSISDSLYEENNKVMYENNLDDSSKVLADFMISIINRIKNDF